MMSAKTKERVAKGILFFTGMMPCLMCWAYIGASNNYMNSEDMWKTISPLIIATLVFIVITHPFRKRNFAWIYNERPILGSFKSALVHLFGGYVAIVSVFAINEAYTRGVGSTPFIFIIGAIAAIISLPGSIVGFYINAHAFTYLAKGKISLHNSQNPKDW